jgi:hypothetical protein
VGIEQGKLLHDHHCPGRGDGCVTYHRQDHLRFLKHTFPLHPYVPTQWEPLRLNCTDPAAEVGTLVEATKEVEAIPLSLQDERSISSINNYGSSPQNVHAGSGP